MRLMLRPCRVNCEHKTLRGLWCNHENPTATPFPSDCPRYATRWTLRCGVWAKGTEEKD